MFSECSTFSTFSFVRVQVCVVKLVFSERVHISVQERKLHQSQSSQTALLTRTVRGTKRIKFNENNLCKERKRLEEKMVWPHSKKGARKVYKSSQAPSTQHPAPSAQQPAGSGQQPAAASRQQTPPCAAENLVVIWRVHCGLLQSVVYCWLLLLVAAGCAAGCLLYCLLLPALLAAVLLVACCLLLSLVLVGACCWLLLLLLLVAAGCCCCCCCRCCCCCCCCLY